ncbi:MAG: serine/threonine protein kinase [Candidatus Obscuribacterales bacterium]|nr:serine/threonine protein kinase [Candidatus Obscuribacterales bacterium]
MKDSRQIDAATDDPLIGQLFEGRFEMLSIIGEGGMGKVYKARHVHMDKFVAIKTLVSSALTDQKSFMRFKQESRAASSLGHPNIISIYDFGASVDGLAYLVMEFVEGKNLEEIILTQETMDLQRFLRIFSQVCSGMQHAHKRGFIHRDLKPSNLMVFDTEDDTDVVKILDFGLAKACSGDDKQNLTRTGMVMGSPPFMSPEQCRGEDLDNRSDIYSLGCVMFAALTGEVPLLGDNTMATLYKHISGQPSSMAEVAPHVLVPASLETLIMRTLEKQPGSRPQSMAELGEGIAVAIETYLKSGVSVSAHSSRTENGAASPPVIPGTNGAAEANPLPRVASLRGALQQSMLRPSAEPLSTNGALVQDSVSTTKFTQKPAVQAPTAVSNMVAPSGTDAKGRDTLRKLRSDTPSVDPSGPHKTNKGMVALVSMLAILAVGGLCWVQFATRQTAVKVPVSGNLSKPAAAKSESVSADSIASTATATATTSPSLATSASTTASMPSASNSVNKIAVSGIASRTSASRDVDTTARVVSSSRHVATTARTTSASRDVVTNAPAPSAARSVAAAGTNSASAVQQATMEARQFQVKARQAFDEGKLQLARDFSLKQLAREKIMYGAQSPSLLPTLGYIAGCARNARERQNISREIELAMTIFAGNNERASNSLNSCDFPFDSWHSLALAALDLGELSSSPQDRQRYYQWAQVFFEGARSSWSGPRGPAFFQMLRQYLLTSTRLRDVRRTGMLQSELRQNHQYQQRAGHPPLRQPVQGTDPNAGAISPNDFDRAQPEPMDPRQRRWRRRFN